MNDILKDAYNRSFSYLRISITDLCNFSCKYCLPVRDNIKCKNYLSVDEIYNLVLAFSELGVSKIRITGGEPTIRNDFIDIGKAISSIFFIKDLVFTTNGFKLYKIIDEVVNSGYNGVNISLDTLDKNKFILITGRNYFKAVLDSIYCSLDYGLKTKVNIVLSDFFSLNDFENFYYLSKYKPIDIRFIEQMETCSIKRGINNFITSSYIKEFLYINNWKNTVKSYIDGPADLFFNNSFIGKIGIINPYSDKFCFNCNRLRISSMGDLFLCLFGNIKYPLRHLLRSSSQKDDLKNFIVDVLKMKNNSHMLNSGNYGMIKSFSSIGG